MDPKDFKFNDDAFDDVFSDAPEHGDGMEDVYSDSKADSQRSFESEFDDIFSGYRFVMFKNYLAFYRISGSDIYVDRVLYAKRDFMKILFGNL